MAICFDSITFTNPTTLPSSSPSMALSRLHPSSLGFRSLFTSGNLPRNHTYLRNRRPLSFIAAAAFHEDSKASDINKSRGGGSQSWSTRTPGSMAGGGSFKQQALKMQSLSKEAYKQYSEKTSEKPGRRSPKKKTTRTLPNFPPLRSHSIQPQSLSSSYSYKRDGLEPEAAENFLWGIQVV